MGCNLRALNWTKRAILINIQSFVFNPFQENTYVIYDDSKEAVVVDPGCYDEDEKTELADFITDNNLVVTMLLNTHCHIDHVLGNRFIKEKFKTKLYIHQTEVFVLNAQKVLAPHYGMHRYEEADPDFFLKEGDTVKFGTQEFLVLFVPGHSPGHIAFYNQNEKVVIAGDVLFQSSIGRTDLPGGNFDTLIDSIHQKLFTLPDDVSVYPGHGEMTNIGVEKRTNPFCAVTNN